MIAPKDNFDLPVGGLPSAYLHPLREEVAKAFAKRTPKDVSAVLDRAHKSAFRHLSGWVGAPRIQFFLPAFGSALAEAAFLETAKERNSALSEALRAAGRREAERMAEAISSGSLSAVEYLARDATPLDPDRVPPFWDAVLRFAAAIFEDAAETFERPAVRGFGLGRANAEITAAGSVCHARNAHHIGLGGMSASLHRPLTAGMMAEAWKAETHLGEYPPPRPSALLERTLLLAAGRAAEEARIDHRALMERALADLERAPPLAPPKSKPEPLPEALAAGRRFSDAAWFLLLHHLFFGYGPIQAAHRVYMTFLRRKGGIGAHVPVEENPRPACATRRKRTAARRKKAMHVLVEAGERVCAALELGSTAADFGHGPPEEGWAEADLRVRLLLAGFAFGPRPDGEPPPPKARHGHPAHTSDAARVVESVLRAMCAGAEAIPPASARGEDGPIPLRLLSQAAAAAHASHPSVAVEIRTSVRHRLFDVVHAHVKRRRPQSSHADLEEAMALADEKEAAERSGLL